MEISSSTLEQPLNTDSGGRYGVLTNDEMLNWRGWNFKNSEREAIVANETTAAEEEELMHTSPPSLSWWTKIAYGAPNFSMTSLTMLIGIHGTIFYIGIGADVAFLAFFISLARSFDVVTDPIMGYISDSTEFIPWKRTLSKWSIVRTVGKYLPTGRRRPYMALFAPGYAITLILLFVPPSGLTEGWKISTWFGVFYIIFYLFDTSANVPWGALGPELSDVPKERDSLFFVSNIFKGTGVLTAAVLPAVLTLIFKDTSNDTPAPLADFGTNYTCPRPAEQRWHVIECPPEEDQDTAEIDAKRTAMAATAMIFGVYYLFTMYIGTWKLREKPQNGKAPQPPIVPAIMSTIRNKPFMIILPAWVLDMTAITMLGTMLPFFTEYVVMPETVESCDRACCSLDDSCRSEKLCRTTIWLAIGLVALMGANVLSMPIWLWATRVFGKRRTWLCFNLLTALTDSLFVFVGAGDPKLCVFFAFLNGIPSGAQFLTESIVADVIDYDELLTGLRSEGRFTIFQTFLPKLVSIPAQTIPLALLSAFGFHKPCSDGTPWHPQPTRIVMFIKVVFFVIPSFCAFASFLIKRRFPITEDMVEQIRLGCAKQAKGKPAYDPVTKTMRHVPFYINDMTALPFVWKLDVFFIDQLLLIEKDITMKTTSGRTAITSHLKKIFIGMSVAAVTFFGITAMSLALGFMSENSTSWVPSFAVILCGMSTTGSYFAYKRYLGAKELLDNQETWAQIQLLLPTVIEHRRGKVSFQNATDSDEEMIRKQSTSQSLSPIPVIASTSHLTDMSSPSSPPAAPTFSQHYQPIQDLGPEPILKFRL